MTTTSLYDGEDILRQTVGTNTTTYIHGPGIDEPLASENAAGVLTYLHADGLGSIVKTSNSSGVAVSTFKYHAFGVLESGAPSSYAFTGREWEPESGLYYYRARYYDPKIGRFISEDPIGFDGGLNFFAYVENSPVNYTDPRGLDNPGCDMVPNALQNPCRSECCAIHDECYASQEPVCDFTSWAYTIGGRRSAPPGAGACVQCNIDVAKCWARCVVTPDFYDDPKRPNCYDANANPPRYGPCPSPSPRTSAPPRTRAPRPKPTPPPDHILSPLLLLGSAPSIKRMPRSVQSSIIGLLAATALVTACGQSRGPRAAPQDELKGFETEMATAGGGRHLYLVNKAARAAFEVGGLDKAQAYATAALEQARSSPRDWNYGNVIHQSNLVLGRVAFARGDVAAAEQRLLEAGRTPGSPQLDSFGPNMTLARDLLQRGRSQVVIEYLQECRRFWEHKDEVQAWIEAIQAGQTPDFGPNLRY